MRKRHCALHSFFVKRRPWHGLLHHLWRWFRLWNSKERLGVYCRLHRRVPGEPSRTPSRREVCQIAAGFVLTRCDLLADFCCLYHLHGTFINPREWTVGTRLASFVCVGNGGSLTDPFAASPLTLFCAPQQQTLAPCPSCRHCTRLEVSQTHSLHSNLHRGAPTLMRTPTPILSLAASESEEVCLLVCSTES